jgi:hypothetical protein
MSTRLLSLFSICSQMFLTTCSVWFLTHYRVYVFWVGCETILFMMWMVCRLRDDLTG